MNPTHALLILGMHRSGTSALTGALALRGLHLGHDLMPPAEGNNPTGFWEHTGVVNIHDQLFKALGHTWCSPAPLPDHWLLHPATETAREQLRTLIQTEFLSHPVWGVKDPRLCRLLPLWRPLLEEFGVTASAVIIARDPREVAASLHARDQLPPEISRQLWLCHLADAIHGSLELPRCALTYPRLLADPVDEIEALVDSLHLPLPAVDTGTLEQITAFIRTQQRHHQAQAATPPEWTLVNALYRQMLHQPTPWDDIHTTARAHLLDGPALVKALDEYARLRERQQRRLDKTQAELLHTHQELNRIWHEFNNTRYTLEHTQKALDRARFSLDELELTWIERDRIRIERDRIRDERDRAREAFAQTQKELDHRTAWALELDATLQGILTSRAWRWARPLRGIEKLLHGRSTPPERPSPDTAAPPLAPEQPEARPEPDKTTLTYLRAAPQAQGYLRDDAKLIAFYLPQYHWVEENSKWWGQGFTEWTNVVRAQPNFEGHYQPHLPGDLGLYDLGDVDTMRKQATLAKDYGIHGFCFYYYWFSGRRILEKPLDNFLVSDIDMPFCLCWANENWTRTWDGGERHILLEQGYAPGDEERFIEDIHPFLADPRYLRVDGKPMLLVYRIKAFPDPKESSEKWQNAAKRLGLPGLHIVVVDFIDMEDHDHPRDLGADAVVEFPPHKYGTLKTIPDTWPPMTNPEFRGCFYEYPAMALHGVSRPTPDFPLYRGIIPGWDNIARRQNTGMSVLNSSPEYFSMWLQFLRAWTRSAHQNTDAPFIFINAWNEWGEGCHLEPDAHWGLAYLDEILRSTHIRPQLQQSLEKAREMTMRAIRDIAARERIVLQEGPYHQPLPANGESSP